MDNIEERYAAEIKSFGERVKEIRVKKGVTQLQLELKTGIDRAEISRIENGLNNIEFFTIVRLASALNLELGDFFHKDKE
jgi:HTH-type transcriptional regulator, competence development regulator